MKKRIVICVLVVSALLAGLGVLASDPMVVCEIDIPEHDMEAVGSQAEGVYSRVLPLVPVCVSVERFSSGRVYYTIHYFPFGTVGMSYAEGDGYNIEKPLTKL